MDPECKQTIPPSLSSLPPLPEPDGADPLEPHGLPAAGANGPVIKRRAPIACRRCRRMRSKCVHDKKPPCQSCKDAGLGPESCIFPVRGQPDHDREFRHPRVKKAEKAAKMDQAAKARRSASAMTGFGSYAGSLSFVPQRTGTVMGADNWDSLPPLPEITDAVNKFTRHYFQLGFIPKQMFSDRLKKDHRSVSVFLLLGILSISARFTPSLIERYGSGIRAAETFIERASAVALNELYREPNLERCQGFYLLSIAQQGSGWKNSSYINLGIAMRMAALMRLHREETYTLTSPSKELVVKAESARRTLWMLHSQDNLHSGPSSLVSLAPGDITALLPSNEEDFANGREPASRAALAGTPPAVENPNLVLDPGRSLFATLIQTHDFWGTISRRAVAQDKSSRPWEPESDYAQMEKKLDEWEDSLPHEHLWSSYWLKRYKVEGLELAYLAVTMVTRLCNIVLRKAYLQNIIYREANETHPHGFWSEMSRQLFRNVKQLYEQIDAEFKDRAPEEGMGAQIAAFCVYSCGIMAVHLCKYPTVCPDASIARDGPLMLKRTITILKESQTVWPLASRWLEGLEKFARAQRGAVNQEASMADGDPVPHVLEPSSPRPPPVATTKTSPDNDKDKVVARGLGQQQLTTAPNSESDNHTMTSLPGIFIEPSMRILDGPSHHQEPPALRQQHPQHQHHVSSQIQQQQQQQQQGHPREQQPQPPQPLPHPQPQHPEGDQQHQHQQPPFPHQIQAGGPRPSQTDGVGLLIEAFDTTHQAGGGVVGAGNPNPASFHDEMTAGHGPPANPANGPQPSAEYFGQGDGYEHELQFYMEGTSSLHHSWVPEGTMYGY